jgi:hypothetical protein
MPVAAMIADYDIAWRKVAQDSDCISLLAKVGVRGSIKPAAWEFLQHGFLETPDPQHPAV